MCRWYRHHILKLHHDSTLSDDGPQLALGIRQVLQHLLANPQRRLGSILVQV